MKLDSVYINLTTACNIRCNHCFLRAGLPQPNELTTHEMKNLIIDIANQGVDKVIFTGGEPLTRFDFLEIAKFASQFRCQGIGQLSLVTNAMLVSYSLSSEIAPLFDLINVSIDGLEQSHDAIRGPGSFHEAIRGLRLLIDAGVEPTVITTITQKNMGILNQTLAYLYQFEGVRNFKYHSLWDIGRAIDNLDLKINYDPEKPSGLNAFEQSGKDCEISGSIGHSLNIYSDGCVYPCHLLVYPEFVAGNVRDLSISEIFHDSIIYNVLREWGIKCCQQVQQPKLELQKQIKLYRGI